MREIDDTSGLVAAQMPPETIRLGSYDADLTVDASDFTRTVMPIGAFQTDGNDDEPLFLFDVTALLHAHAGKPIGFRLELDTPLGFDAIGTFGAQFTVSPLLTRLEYSAVPLPASLFSLVLALPLLFARRSSDSPWGRH